MACSGVNRRGHGMRLEASGAGGVNCSRCSRAAANNLLVLDIPDFLISPARDVRNELTKAPIGIALRQPRNRREQIRTLFAFHGRASFTVPSRGLARRPATGSAVLTVATLERGISSIR